MSFTFWAEYLKVLRIRRGEKSGSSGSKGLNGILKNECIVCPPTLTAAIPVGASTTCSLSVLAQMYFKKVLFPVPAFPVKNTERRVLRIKFHAFWNSRLSRSIFSRLTVFMMRHRKVFKVNQKARLDKNKRRHFINNASSISLFLCAQWRENQNRNPNVSETLLLLSLISSPISPG